MDHQGEARENDGLYSFVLRLPSRRSHCFRSMINAWPVTVLCGATLAAVCALFLVLMDHLRPHPGDLKQIREFFVTQGLHVRTVRRSWAVWRYHYRLAAWKLSRFARFYVVEMEAADGRVTGVIAACDPWKAGIQIVSPANMILERS
jgi:hypothetical protein